MKTPRFEYVGPAPSADPEAPELVLELTTEPGHARRRYSKAELAALAREREHMERGERPPRLPGAKLVH